MVTGTIKIKVDKLWTDIWAGGITNPLTVIEQLTYLMFIRSLDEKELETEEFRFYAGTSYRHLLIWENGDAVDLVQPHDILEQVIGDKLPKEKRLREMMERSYAVLADHPINRKRKEQGLHPANSCWFWGAGTKPSLSPFTEKTGKKGAMTGRPFTRIMWTGAGRGRLCG